MALTRLGWDVFTSPSTPRLANSSWITGKVRGGDHKVVLDELCRRFNAEVEKITQAHSWGWAYRAVRGAAVVSEHAAGTAVDLNAPKHPLSKSGTFSCAQVSRIRAILRDLDGVVRWGGDYAGRKDEMHFELQGGNEAIGKVANKIRSGAIILKPATGSKPVAQQSAKNPPNGSTNFPKNYAELAVDGDFESLSVGALQILLHAAGYRNNKQWDGVLGKLGWMDVQEWLAATGFLDTKKWLIDGKPETETIKALQRMLVARGRLDPKKWAIDGKFQAETKKALQRHLNANN